jgi:hypothetical protein
MSNLKPKNTGMISLTLWLMLGLNALFVWTEFNSQLLPECALWLDNGLDSVRIPLTIIELIAVSTLFVDLVLRFDFINLKRRNLHVFAVGICVCGFLFKAFIFFLHSAYLS